ncbi:S-layer homology domain-containing protein [Vermiculatibacterium agrestimuris]|uniref:S-layer homology domain-containing protein n=1 Tax=Vermiculatibacterium agrestimuris TaxID=2941519 RepID=UPI00204258D9|nr:S-layer homology domain-containing protein [Vermiculatibacterium agrestimuris]
MNNLKRVLSLGLVGTMLAGMMVMGASAAEFTDGEKIEHADAVSTLVALKIVDGKPDGSFDPEGNVTRAEMAKMIATAMNGGNEANTGVKTNPTFTDIKGHWAESYIEYCSDMKIISGRGDGTFDPGANVTGLEATKMVLTALGYAADAYQLTGATWATRTDELARQASPKLYEDLETVMMANAATRDTAAQLIWNGLQNTTKQVRPTTGVNTGSIEWTYEDGQMMLTERYGAQIFEGTFEGNYNTSATGAAKGEIQIKGRLRGAAEVAANGNPISPTTANFPSDLDISFIGEKFKVIFKDGNGGQKNAPDKKDTIYGVFNMDETKVYRITKGDLQDAKDEVNNGRIKFGDVLYDVAGVDENDKAVIWNYGNTADTLGSTVHGSAADATKVEFATWINTAANGLRVKSTDTIKFITDDNGAICKAYVETWTPSTVLSKTSSKVQLEGVGSKDLENVRFVGDEAGKDDLVATAAFYNGSNAEQQVKKLTTVEGKVEAKDGDKLRIDGTWYDKSANFKALSDYATTTFNVGDEYKLVLEGEKYYVAGATISAETDFAMVLRTQKGITDQVKLLLADGSEKTFSVHKDSTVKVITNSTSTVNGNEIAINEDAGAVMVKYETLRNGTEVKMTLVAPVKDASGTTTHTFNKNTKVLTTINGSNPAVTQVVSADAIAFIYFVDENDATNSKWKVFNANTTSSINAKDETNAYVGTKSDKVAAFALTTTTMPTGAGDSSRYGFVTGKVETTYGSDNEKGTEFTVWNGDESDTVLVEGTSAVTKGAFVKYTISDSAISSTEFEALSPSIVKVKEHDTARKLVITTTETYGVNGVIAGTDTSYRMNDDTVIIGVKMDGNKASTNNTIQKYTQISGSDFNNAALVLGTGDEADLIKAIYVDEDNKIDGSGAASAPVTVGNATDVTQAGVKVTAVADKTSASVKEKVKYTVTVSGTAGTGAADDTITLAITGLSGATALAPTSGTNCTVSGLVITITADDVATSGTFTVEGTVTGAVSATLTGAAA